MDGSFTIARDLNLVTIYAAVVSTAVLLWQVFTYLREGARLRVRAGSNMKTFGHGGASPETYLSLNVVNVGTADTTITHIVVLGYNNWWRRLRHRPSKHMLVPDPSPNQPIPFVLEVGRVYLGLGIQDATVEQLSRETLLYMGVYHSFADKPVLARIRPITTPADVS